MDSAKAAERAIVLTIKIVVGAQGIHAVLRVSGVIDEVKRLVPLPTISSEHDRVRGGHNLGKRRRPTPVTGCAAGHGMDIH